MARVINKLVGNLGSQDALVVLFINNKNINNGVTRRKRCMLKLMHIRGSSRFGGKGVKWGPVTP